MRNFDARIVDKMRAFEKKQLKTKRLSLISICGE